MNAATANQWGPLLDGDMTRFRLWAPDRDEIVLEIPNTAPTPMIVMDNGWHEAVAMAPPGTPYRFRVGDLCVPDPAARLSRADGFCIVADTGSYRWRIPGWKGRPWEEAILYEVHAGLLGGFRGVAEHLSSLKYLGITAVELMPIADFPGARNWGYDGVLPFAPDEAYGSPEDLRYLIDAAHGLELMVFLDVVYNHFGPDGNYLPLYAAPFFRGDESTPWGSAIDFRVPAVRRFFIENALYWIHEFRVDGLRFDAVHAVRDNEFLKELATEIRNSLPQDRHVHLVVENENNDATLLQRGVFDAQWNDDIHHALHVILTGETDGYYRDYAEAPARKLARGLREGFIFQGDHSQNSGKPRGTPSVHLPPTAFVTFLQNHDHIGNRAFGERLIALADERALKAATALVLLSPQVPLIFMGEDAGACEPFLYFSDHHDVSLAQAVRDGRRNEFAKFPQFADANTLCKIPDPNAPESYERSRPCFNASGAPKWRSFYRSLLKLRHAYIIPRLKGSHAEQAYAVGEKAVVASWRLGDGAVLTLACNLGPSPISTELPNGLPIWGQEADTLRSYTTLCWIDIP